MSNTQDVLRGQWVRVRHGKEYFLQTGQCSGAGAAVIAGVAPSSNGGPYYKHQNDSQGTRIANIEICYFFLISLNLYNKKLPQLKKFPEDY